MKVMQPTTSAPTAELCQSLMICPGCGESTSIRKDKRWIDCTICNQQYPLIGGKIPVLIQDPENYLASLYLQHKRYISQQESQIARIRHQVKNHPSYRHESLLHLADALETNVKLIQSNLDEFMDFVTVDNLTDAIHQPKFITYSNTLRYLERDWCYLSHNEAELEHIQKHTLKTLKHNHNDLSTALVLGAGTGRLAWEGLDIFDRVFALDHSLTMAQQFHQVINNPLRFYSVDTLNMTSNADQVIQRSTSAGQSADYYAADPKSKLDSMTYMVADARAIPITDVLPLHEYFSELKRVLKPNGVFCHFGPLEYHFDDITQHLSAEEIKNYFAKNGFKIISDYHVKGEHLHREGSMSHRIYNNWVFQAVKME